MDFQKELSVNAKNPQEVERQAKQQAEQRMQEQARSLAKKICQQIKPQLLEKVKLGNFTKKYNKGTVTCYVDIPGNRYLKIDSKSEYQRNTYVRTRKWLYFLVKQETWPEYACLRDELNTWGKTEQIEISFVVLMRNSTYESDFPCGTPQEFPPNTFPAFQLAVKAVSHFPVDPSLPMDYMTEDDILDWHKKIDRHIARCEDVCISYKKELVRSCCIAVFSVIAFIIFCWLQGVFFILLFLFAAILFSSAAYDAHKKYEESKTNLENARVNAERQKGSTSHQ